MARPQSPDYDRRRDAIIDTAAALYARRSFQGTSVADLAAACSTSKSLIYHYFPSKEDILHEVMASHLGLLLEAAERHGKGSGPPQQRLHALARDLMQIYAGAAHRHKVLLNELEHLPADRKQQIVRQQRRIIEIVEALMHEIRPDLAASALAVPAAMLFFGMINWTHSWFDPEGPVSPERFADLAVDVMLKGIAEAPLQAS